MLAFSVAVGCLSRSYEPGATFSGLLSSVGCEEVACYKPSLPVTAAPCENEVLNQFTAGVAGWTSATALLVERGAVANWTRPDLSIRCARVRRRRYGGPGRLLPEAGTRSDELDRHGDGDVGGEAQQDPRLATVASDVGAFKSQIRTRPSRPFGGYHPVDDRLERDPQVCALWGRSSDAVF